MTKKSAINSHSLWPGFHLLALKKLFTTSAHKYVYQCLHKKKHIEDIMKQEGALPLNTGSKRLKQEQIGTVIYFT